MVDKIKYSVLSLKEWFRIMKRNLKENFIYNLISQVLVLIIPLITAPYLARVLGETGNGQLSYANSIITYFTLIANLGFSLYGQREISRKRDDIKEKSKSFYEIIILRFFCTMISLIILFIILYTIDFGEAYTKLILILSIQIPAVFLDISFYYQGVEDFKSIAIRSIIMKLIGLVCIFVFVKKAEDLWIYALCLSLTIVFSNLIMWPKIFKQLTKVKLKELNLKKNIKPSLLIFLPTLAVTIYSVLDKTMIGLLSPNPDYDNGCYEQAYKINSMALIIITVISPIMIPRNTYDYSVGDFDNLKKHIYFSSNYVWLLSMPLIAGFIALSSNLSSWFLGDGYTEVPLMLNIMSIRFVAAGFGVTFGDQLFIAIGKEKYAVLATASAAIVNFGLNFWLIPRYGAIGAAITTAISEVLVALILAVCVWRYKYVSIRHVLKMSWRYIISAGVMFICIYFIQKYMPYKIWSFLVITFTGMIIYGIILLLLRDKFFINLITTSFDFLRKKLHMERKTKNE